MTYKCSKWAYRILSLFCNLFEILVSKKQNKTKIKQKQNKNKNKQKTNKTKQNKTKQNNTKQYKTIQNKTKQKTRIFLITHAKLYSWKAFRLEDKKIKKRLLVIYMSYTVRNISNT